MRYEELQRFRGKAIQYENSDQGPPGAFRPPSCMYQDTQDGEGNQVNSKFAPRKGWDSLQVD